MFCGTVSIAISGTICLVRMDVSADAETQQSSDGRSEVYDHDGQTKQEVEQKLPGVDCE